MVRPSPPRPRRAAPAMAAALALACGFAPPASAATALDIHAPEGFTVRRSTPAEADDAGYEVEAASDADVGCQVNLTGTRRPRGPDQAALNAEATGPAYLARVRADLAETFDVREVAPFSLQGADGSVAVADPKVGGGTARAAIYDLDTPRGNLEVLCVSSADEFDAWRPLFERIARGVALPR